MVGLLCFSLMAQNIYKQHYNKQGSNFSMNAMELERVLNMSFER